jgi:hypothetical protein
MCVRNYFLFFLNCIINHICVPLFIDTKPNTIQALDKKKLNVSVCGIPKTIDNDVGVIDYSFGFHSAVQAAQLAISTAVVEAKGNMPNGIGVVKRRSLSSMYRSIFLSYLSHTHTLSLSLLLCLFLFPCHPHALTIICKICANG